MRIAVLLTIAALGTGCGAETTSAGSADVTTSRAGPAGTELTVVVRTGERGQKRTYTLTCDPPGGDHPAPAAACEALAGLDDPFAPVPANTACTDIYGGPQRATVTGTFRGDPVKAEFSRSDGCQIARWDAHVELLVEAGGAQGS